MEDPEVGILIADTPSNIIGSCNSLLKSILYIKQLNMMIQKCVYKYYIQWKDFYQYQKQQYYYCIIILFYSNKTYNGFVNDVCDLMCHPDKEVSRMAFEVGEILIDIDSTEGNGNISDIVMKQKYQIYNKEWIEVVCREGNSDSVYYDSESNIV